MGECPHRYQSDADRAALCRIETDEYAVWVCDETHKAGYENCAVYQRARAEGWKADAEALAGVARWLYPPRMCKALAAHAALLKAEGESKGG